MFRKLGAFYKRNRIYSILMIISLMCIIAILAGVMLYFVGQTNKNPYGNRLEGLIEVSEKNLKDIESKIKENELVKETSIEIKGSIIYVVITINTGKRSDAEALGQTTLEMFDEKVKTAYDIHYSVINEDKTIEERFPIEGYIKAGNSVIKWTNNYIEPVVEGETDEN